VTDFCTLAVRTCGEYQGVRIEYAIRCISTAIRHSVAQLSLLFTNNTPACCFSTRYVLHDDGDDDDKRLFLRTELRFQPGSGLQLAGAIRR